MSDHEETPLPEVPPLVTLGDPRLARPSAPVDPKRISSPEFQQRLNTLADAMAVYLGIGIAAPQIGWFERFFLVLEEVQEGEAPPHHILHAWINPEITMVSKEQGWAWEGCLSVPGLRGWVRRPLSIAVRGYDAGGNLVSREFSGWPARVFQHEYDHLDGYLYPYRISDPRHLMMTEHLEHREAWPEDWPAPGARDTLPGMVLPE
ncbi:MAG: peptide deformylase [Deltaproteobacteria bacterium]|nr:peptide deformylase [Deltaproteobacteria bacterium]